jgi:hypothetical protein
MWSFHKKKFRVKKVWQSWNLSTCFREGSISPRKTYAISLLLAEILPVPISPDVPISPNVPRLPKMRHIAVFRSLFHKLHFGRHEWDYLQCWISQITFFQLLFDLVKWSSKFHEFWWFNSFETTVKRLFKTENKFKLWRHYERPRIFDFSVGKNCFYLYIAESANIAENAQYRKIFFEKKHRRYCPPCNVCFALINGWQYHIRFILKTKYSL